MTRAAWFAALVAASCSSTEVTSPPPSAIRDCPLAPSLEVNPRLLRRFRPIANAEPVRKVTTEQVALGRRLFYETRLSRDGTLSCNGCHPLDRFGMDGRSTSVGIHGRVGRRNAPTVYNAATHFAQFWDGRAATTEDQAPMPIMNSDEMGMDPDAVVATLGALPEYVDAFTRAYPGDPAPITVAHVGNAIAAFERGLVTVSRWDEFLAGRPAALTALERRGLRSFLDSGCMVCHTGPQVGGTMFERVGVVEPWPNDDDLGRAEVTGSAADRMMFKVPSLKNIAMTAPYFHDGSVATLEHAIQMMGRHQLGIELGEPDIAAIAAWMRSMTGDIDRAYIEPR
jgi:cytochrome c peroxidase